MKTLKLTAGALAIFAATLSQAAFAAPDLKVALIAGKTGLLESYARESETGFMMGLEYLTGGKMEINGRKIRVIVKDDQSKPMATTRSTSRSAPRPPGRRWRCCRSRPNTRRS